MQLSKPLSLLIVLVSYIAAFFVGLLTLRLLGGLGFLVFLAADAAATVAVWAIGLAFKNASLYDPYWSVAPLVLFIGFTATAGHFDAVDALYAGVFAVWGVRLTLNWVIGWRGMAHQDWRYTMLKQKNPKLWPLTNFFGINMMPTLIVFANLLGAYLCALHSGDGAGIVSILGTFVCLLAVGLQTVADAQMRRFRRDPANRERSINEGVWRYSRHPNYLGEISFWWGIWLIQLGALPHLWWTVVAPVLMTLLFLLISIPMMENRLSETKTDYDDYRRRTSLLLPFPQQRDTGAAV